MNACCTKTKAKFCPECGTPLATTPLQSLLCHVRRTKEGLQASQALMERHPMNDGSEKERAWFAKKRATLKRWEEWETALIAALARDSGKRPPETDAGK